MDRANARTCSSSKSSIAGRRLVLISPSFAASRVATIPASVSRFGVAAVQPNPATRIAVTTVADVFQAIAVLPPGSRRRSGRFEMRVAAFRAAVVLGALPLCGKSQTPNGREIATHDRCAGELDTTRGKKRKGRTRAGPPPSYFCWIRRALLQVVVHQLGHLEHRDLGLAPEDRLELVVRVDLPLVLLVLQLVGL